MSIFYKIEIKFLVAFMVLWGLILSLMMIRHYRDPVGSEFSNQYSSRPRKSEIRPRLEFLGFVYQERGKPPTPRMRVYEAMRSPNYSWMQFLPLVLGCFLFAHFAWQVAGKNQFPERTFAFGLMDIAFLLLLVAFPPSGAGTVILPPLALFAVLIVSFGLLYGGVAVLRFKGDGY